MQVQVLWVILSVICLERTKVYCFLMKCPSYQLHFQKIVGYRPKLLPLGNHDLLRFVNPDPSLPVSMMCWNSCQADQECIGYVLFVTSNTCYGYTLLRKSTRYMVLDGPEEDLVVDSDAIYFQKSCLNVPENCETQLWAITRIPGSSLVFQGKKTIATLVTRRECAEKCIFEKEFQCLSAAYRPSYKNNHARLQSAFKPAEVVGQCILTDKDKTTHPDAYRVAPTDEEYMENNCYQRPPENDTCSYELYSNSSFIYSDLRHDGLTQKECQHNCSHQSGFHCQGVSYEEEAPGQSSKCFLHSEDLISMGPRSLAVKANSVYMRRVKCLDVSVVCSQEEMIITYRPSDWFRGKIYVSSHSDECSVGGNGTNPTMLRLPIGSEIKESRCGLLRAYEVKGSLKRTFISTLVVIQNNLNVQTQGDRLIKVGCILNNSSNQIPDDVALGSSLAFTQSEFPNAGSLLYNISDKMPKILMHVLDLNGHLETNDVQIGQNLELQIIAEPNDSLYDIRAVSLTAKSLGDDSSSVTLIDSRGCPTDAAIFPALEKVVHNGKKMLRARFLAFKFAGTPVVNFDVKIQFCLTECPAANCDNNVLSHGRRRKRDRGAMANVTNDNNTEITNTLVQVRYPFKYTSFLGSSDVIPLVASASSQVRNDSTTSKSNLEYPLHFKLYVRGPNTGEPTTMIYGENGPIIVSGFGIVRKEVVCLDHSLLIAIIIFWIIFQILLMVSCCYLVRKYKRLGNLEEDRSSMNADSSRRVHWADQGSGFYFA